MRLCKMNVTTNITDAANTAVRLPFQGNAANFRDPGLKPRLRKAYVAANLYGESNLDIRARQSVATAAWAVFFNHFMVNSDQRPTNNSCPVYE
jgi:hypothetical protein